MTIKSGSFPCFTWTVICVGPSPSHVTMNNILGPGRSLLSAVDLAGGLTGLDRVGHAGEALRSHVVLHRFNRTEGIGRHDVGVAVEPASQRVPGETQHLACRIVALGDDKMIRQFLTSQD